MWVSALLLLVESANDHKTLPADLPQFVLHPPSNCFSTNNFHWTKIVDTIIIFPFHWTDRIYFVFTENNKAVLCCFAISSACKMLFHWRWIHYIQCNTPGKDDLKILWGIYIARLRCLSISVSQSECFFPKASSCCLFTFCSLSFADGECKTSKSTAGPSSVPLAFFCYKRITRIWLTLKMKVTITKYDIHTGAIRGRMSNSVKVIWHILTIALSFISFPDSDILTFQKYELENSGQYQEKEKRDYRRSISSINLHKNHNLNS